MRRLLLWWAVLAIQKWWPDRIYTIYYITVNGQFHYDQITGQEYMEEIKIQLDSQERLLSIKDTPDLPGETIFIRDNLAGLRGVETGRYHSGYGREDDSRDNPSGPKGSEIEEE